MLCQDGATPPAVDVGRGEIVDALVVSVVVVVGNEIKKNAHRLIVVCALANLFMVRRHLLRWQQA
jgi:hypothetical protein